MIEYNKRLVEVDEILNHLSIEDYNRIPKEYIILIKQNKDINYIWKYDTNKKLKDQDISDDTIAILSYINMEFLLNDDQKNFINRLHILNNIDTNSNNTFDYKKDIFTKKSNQTKEYNTNNIIVIHSENIFQKITNKIRNVFNKKN